MIVSYIVCDGCQAKVEKPSQHPEHHYVTIAEQVGIQSLDTKSYHLCNDCGSLLKALLENHSIQKVLKSKS